MVLASAIRTNIIETISKYKRVAVLTSTVISDELFKPVGEVAIVDTGNFVALQKVTMIQYLCWTVIRSKLFNGVESRVQVWILLNSVFIVVVPLLHFGFVLYNLSIPHPRSHSEEGWRVMVVMSELH